MWRYVKFKKNMSTIDFIYREKRHRRFCICILYLYLCGLVALQDGWRDQGEPHGGVSKSPVKTVREWGDQTPDLQGNVRPHQG
jgi:hypothetical protein